MTAALLRLAYFVSGRTVLNRPYVCGSCPQIRCSLTAAQYRRWAESRVVLCRCGQHMHHIQHPSYADFRVETTR